MSKIDFVIYWVNGNDPEWQKQYCKYRGIEFESESARYRDWGFLKYWFRSVEKYAPWVNNIYFVTNGQCPEWLNLKNPKLQFVKHSEYIPEKYLPTFNSHTIELNIHQIKGLSEQFVIFNDDTIINAPVSPEYYFKNGLPCDATLENVFGGPGYNKEEKWGISIIDYCNTQVINAYFNRQTVTKGNLYRWYGPYLGIKNLLYALLIGLCRRPYFCHFEISHNEKPMLKTTYNEIWNTIPDLLFESCTQFRENTNLSCYIIRYWQLVTNRFYPKNQKSKRVISITKPNLDLILDLINNSKYKSLCLNDVAACSESFYIEAKEKINSVLEKRFPNKSSYEK